MLQPGGGVAGDRLADVLTRQRLVGPALGPDRIAVGPDDERVVLGRDVLAVQDALLGRGAPGGEVVEAVSATAASWTVRPRGEPVSSSAVSRAIVHSLPGWSAA
ncbi:hypothetical protein AB0I68_31000 [Streptomyces sp. NPDC050448]|uniref:hypothetical protein n=1 Tax=Streptomyces sp. NPDC050448 TaxID=3155404 RepID=UPI00344576F6